MNKAKQFLGCGFGTFISAVGTYSQTNAELERISLYLTILGSLVTLLVAVVPLAVKLFKKVKNALEDGKITKEEASEIVNDACDLANEIKTQVDNLDKREEIKKKKGGKHG